MSFKSDIKNFINKVEGRAKEVIAGAATNMAANIIKQTPKDEKYGPNNEFPVWYDSSSVGRAKAGWTASINSPNFAQNNNLDIDGSATTAKVRQEFDAYIPKRDRSLHLSNAVEYIELLENGGYAELFTNPIKTNSAGFSFNAPQGMMKIHTNVWRGYVRAALSGRGGVAR